MVPTIAASRPAPDPFHPCVAPHLTKLARVSIEQHWRVLHHLFLFGHPAAESDNVEVPHYLLLLIIWLSELGRVLNKLAKATGHDLSSHDFRPCRLSLLWLRVVLARAALIEPNTKLVNLMVHEPCLLDLP